MKLQITRYGKSKSAGGWDPYGDSGTDKLQGDHGNTLVDKVSCALTKSARDLLQAKHGDWLHIVFPDGTFQNRRYDDTALEENGRLDCFYERKDQALPDYAEVSVIPL